MVIETKQVKVDTVQKVTDTYKGSLRRGFKSADGVWYNIVGSTAAAIDAQFNPDLIDRGNTVEVSYDPASRNVETVKLVEKGKAKPFVGSGGKPFGRDDSVHLTHDQCDEAMKKSIDTVLDKFKAKGLAITAATLKDGGVASIINSLFIGKTRSSFNKVVG